jgi:hypothetical protein
MAEDLEFKAPPLHPAHRRRLTALSALMHVGLVVISACAVYSLQPLMGPRHWAAYVLVALAMLVGAAATRGRYSFADGGKLLTALGAGLVFKLASEPQLANLPWPGEHLPSWLAGANLTIASVGLLVAAIFGFWLLRTLTDYLGHAHEPPFLWALNGSVLLILVLSAVTFSTLRRFYEIDGIYLALLVGNAVQYYLLLRLTLSASGRKMVGALPQVILALAILAACARNVLGGMMGGEAP